MHLLPIISTLRRHKTTTTLIVLEFALTCAIVCNAMFMISDRLARMSRASGLVEDELVAVAVTGIDTQTDPIAATARDLAALRAIPGVEHVAATNSWPFGGWDMGISTTTDDPNSIGSMIYEGSPDLLATLGVQLIAGRDFQLTEYVDFDSNHPDTVHVPSVILTRELAERLFPGQNALGKSVYVVGKEPQIVVGIIEHITRARPIGYGSDPVAGQGYAILLPVNLPYGDGFYLLRTDRERRGEVLTTAEATLTNLDPVRIFGLKKTYTEVRRGYFKEDRAMASLLVGVSLGLLLITGLGVFGLASFWVQQRTRQIGIRRALGATRTDIVHYFQVENFVLATLGIVLGMALAYAINLWLMHKYQVPRLPAAYLPIGAASLWALGQLAVLGPALRASLISPALATRSL
jgi:putative ABC transport system permease protein